MYSVFLLGFAKHQDIIQIYNYKIVNEWMKDIIHDPHESSRCVTEPERHHKPFIQTLFCFKRCFLGIIFSNTDLMIPTTQIQFCKISCMFQPRGIHLLTNILSRQFILWVLKLSKIEPIYCRYWGDEGFKLGLGKVVYKD